MKSIINEYLGKGLSFIQLQEELQALIKGYNQKTGSYLFLYAADLNKGGNRNINVSLSQDDFYIVQDILREMDKRDIDFYLETPGGSGEAAEEIARFLRKKFNHIRFVVSGEAKSAGTIMALSGDDISMTDSGSLGPIDAQMQIGRSVISAHDYKEWVDEKQKDALESGRLNPFDAIMIAQISPGELKGVVNALEFAKDLVKEWLEKHKFKNWNKTESRGIVVTPEYKKKRAAEIADKLCDHTQWRSHGRSLKIDDLRHLGLKINRIDDDSVLKDIVYRIQVVVRFIFDTSTAYKLFFTEDVKLMRTYSVSPQTNQPANQQKKASPPAVDINAPLDVEFNCPKCNKAHKILGIFEGSKASPEALKNNKGINEKGLLICDNCSFAIDLAPIKNQIETQTKTKVKFQ